jgi:hypothetical protein
MGRKAPLLFSIRPFVADWRKWAPEGICRPLDTVVAKERPCRPTSHPQPTDGLLEGPTADDCEKGGGRMSASPLPTFRKEVQNYLRSSEHLWSVAAADHPPFTAEELQIVNYYAAEVAQMVGQLAKV